MPNNTTTNIVKGDELMVFMGGSALAYSTSHTLSITGNSIDISSKDHGFWGASEVGNITWEITTENLYTDADFDALFDAMLNKTPVAIHFSRAANYDPNGLKDAGGTVTAWTEGTGYSGMAIISSLTANANTGENATFSATFTGRGAIIKGSIETSGGTT